ncbi:NAD(P)/FAD-dependent oxidoreductase [Candidatus Contubernalis alkaliaceticus]|uniref:NAD(P)/FAD-dependent oxidoreductase n=1 Tax=Candidatus Contubernalis alkaliaceticus TaxID=338645 RepID=UPI001F4C128F|nr:geranylgeranyl reductase family protein [Candidatus Contubernalis alkalaceticus]UNC93393.1 geranylgeranyl reductase family protein [Candidatus Contubernalis alkalaceticus]
MNYDLAVIGAGPAGASAARNAALKGLSVVIIEKQALPRMKPCAGLVSKKALTELDFDLPEGLTAQKIRGVKLVDSVFNEFTEKTSRIIGRTVKRSEFDAFLTQKAREAGADLKDNTRLLDFKEEGQKIVLNTSQGQLTCRFLVGADGVYSRVAKKSGIRKKWRRWDLGFTLYMDLPLEGPVEGIDPEVAELHCVSHPFSMGWLFHHENYLNIGIGTSKLVEKKSIGVFHNWLDRLCREKNLPLKDYKTQGYYLPAGGFKRAISQGQVYLAGDAAGFVDSFSGEGIYFALKSGRFIAEEIISGLEQNRIEQIGSRYTNRCYQDFLKEFRLSLAVAILLGKKVIPFQFVRYNPFLVRYIANIMENTGGYGPMLKDIGIKFPQLLSRYAKGKIGQEKS